MSGSAGKKPTPGPYAGRRLVLFLCMHRTGSSLATAALSRMGMSVGPFPLVGAAESNKYGHFESVPFHTLNRELQKLVLGFSDDLPESPETLRRFCQSEGRWEPGVELPESAYERAREIVGQMIASGPISGFKDPRTLLLWPFWSKVLSEFKGLELVPLFLVRSPHEIAMSIFARAKGTMSYGDALDVTAVHFRRMLEIRGELAGPRPVVCFEPHVFAADLRRAAAACGLTWSDATFKELYDESCRHHEPAVVTHRAQALFRRLRPDARRVSPSENIKRIEADAAGRETTMRGQMEELRGETGQLRGELEACRAENAQYAQTLALVSSELETCRKENEQYAGALKRCGDQFQECLEGNQRYERALAQCGQQLEHYRQEAEQYAEALAQSERDQVSARESAARAASLYEAELARRQNALQQAASQLDQLRAETQQLTAALTARHAELDRVSQENTANAGSLAAAREEIVRLEAALYELRQRSGAVEHELNLIKRTRTWRFREMVITRLRAG